MARTSTVVVNAGGPSGHRDGKPLVYSLSEALVLILIALALVASAALPAALRHPHVAQAYSRDASRPAAAGGR